MKNIQFDKSAEFVLSDQIGHPAFFWPETLIGYKVSFTDFDKKDKERLVLTDVNGNVLPYQLKNEIYSGNFLKSAELNFISALASGETKKFTLTLSDSRIIQKKGIQKEETEKSLILFNGKFKAELPKSQKALYKIPAPIISVDRGAGRIGDNSISAGQADITLTEISDGALFCEYKIFYDFGNGKNYTVTVKFIKDYEFCELFEEMSGIEPSDRIFTEYRWTNFPATNQYMSTWPDDRWERKSEKYGDYDWKKVGHDCLPCYYGEDPRFQGGSMFGEDAVGHDGEALRFGPYAPFFAYSIRPCGAYWDERTKESLGIFVNGTDNWDDEEYSVWAAGDKLAGRYYYENETVIWRLPIASGKRSIALACYSRARDEAWFKKLSELCSEMQKMGVSPEEAEKLTSYPCSYTSFLHNRYVTLNLNKIKDWELSYNGKTPSESSFTDVSLKFAEEFYKFIISTGRIALATKGTEEFHDRPYTFEAVEIRMMYDTICDSYMRFKDELPPEKLKTVTALILLTCYVCAGEEAIPMKTMLGGHPNFLTDIKCSAAIGAALFPEHPAAKKFADIFEKFIELNTRYHTRPAVKSYNSSGGRWTEAIGIYTWAFLGPTALTDALLRRYFDSKTRLANDKIAEISKWIIGLLSSPIRLEGKEIRAMSTQGAHSALRAVPKVFRLIADGLKNYDPRLSDNMYYITKNSVDYIPEANYKHLKWSYLYSDDKIFAKPDLKSEKYTGYGVIMRSKPYTESEMSVHLQQIDAGPNYRWGMANAGGCGSIFYYADKKCYSYNGKEDAGDRRADDASYSTCFGVWKQHCFRSIGQNVLSEPLLALGEIQYQKIKSDDKIIYSYPEYQSRSVMLAGGDYIVIYDAVSHPNVYTRFSWFVRKEDEFPFIHFVKGITMDRFAIKNYAFSEHITPQSKGRWYEGSGDCMAVVSHRKDISVNNTSYGCAVTLKDSTDYIINSANEQNINGEFEFCGKVGAIRVSGKKATLSVIDGTKAAFGDFSAECENSSFSLDFKNKEASGKIHTYSDDILKISGVSGKVYLDYEEISGDILLKPGEHTIEITCGDMTPKKPVIERIRGNKIVFTPSKGAKKHIFEMSLDGEHFTEIGEEIKTEEKAVIRMKGINGIKESEYSAEYPVYKSDQAPAAPAGVKYTKGKISWGEVYSAIEYRLYRKDETSGSVTLIYSGEERSFTDEEKGKFSYYVTCLNHNGESEPSFPCDNFNEILNFYPRTFFDRFSKKYAYLEPPYYTGTAPDYTYPE